MEMDGVPTDQRRAFSVNRACHPYPGTPGPRLAHVEWPLTTYPPHACAFSSCPPPQGGKIVDSKVNVGSKDSVPEALKFIVGV